MPAKVYVITPEDPTDPDAFAVLEACRVLYYEQNGEQHAQAIDDPAITVETERGEGCTGEGWSVYGRSREGLAVWIQDFDGRDDALLFLRRLSGRPCDAAHPDCPIEIARDAIAKAEGGAR